MIITVKKKRLVKIIFKLIETELMELIGEYFLCLKTFFLIFNEKTILY